MKNIRELLNEHFIEPIEYKISIVLEKIQAKLDVIIYKKAREAFEKEDYTEAWQKYNEILRQIENSREAYCLFRYAYACHLIKLDNINANSMNGPLKLNFEVENMFNEIFSYMNNDEVYLGISKNYVYFKYGSYKESLGLLNQAVANYSNGIAIENSNQTDLQMSLFLQRAKVYMHLCQYELAKKDLINNATKLEEIKREKYIWNEVNYKVLTEETHGLLTICNKQMKSYEKVHPLFSTNLFKAAEKTSGVASPEIELRFT